MFLNTFSYVDFPPFHDLIYHCKDEGGQDGESENISGNNTIYTKFYWTINNVSEVPISILNTSKFSDHIGEGKCGSFASQTFSKGCSGTEIYLGRGLSWSQCANECGQYASRHGVGCCEGQAESWGKCTYYVGGSQIQGNDDSKSVQCTLHQGKDRLELF